MTFISLRTLSAIAATTLIAGVIGDTTLGGVNMQACCQEQYSNGSEQAIAGSGCDDWQCYNPTNGNWDGGIDISRCCQQTYSNGGAYSGCSGGAYNWQCYAP
ncbi:hypothetical protein TGAM01_v208007 [Trichoderma gamsii]|uniref:Uncharacterized protein n=1 Tax=Trichoderma gamsii TaxID=398673 RepID=A0A2P4ZFF0_9HYPO|nr:hypothetical protein TGAM01_v208007 [Trichoderma gamsii]PON23002.1 hypothetical protein TGAM01_v208007 [Trichoderma gamsii]